VFRPHNNLLFLGCKPIIPEPNGNALGCYIHSIYAPCKGKITILSLQSAYRFFIFIHPRRCHWASIYCHFVANYWCTFDFVLKKLTDNCLKIYYNKHLGVRSKRLYQLVLIIRIQDSQVISNRKPTYKSLETNTSSGLVGNCLFPDFLILVNNIIIVSKLNV